MSVTDHIMKYLPSYYQDIEDFTAMAAAENSEFDSLDTDVQRLLDDQFVLTASTAAIARREAMLGIQADPSKETLDFRRKRILNRYQTKPPFTVRYLQQQLDRLVGPGMTVVSVDVQNFILYVTTNIENANVFKEIIRTVEMVKPANIVYQQNTALNITLELDESISRQTIDWNYKLDGSWNLGEKAFSTLGVEVPVI
ncbi:putative phage tail protein [Cohnella zeiphila]|uniref:putative phage tail protein n=1 Tax=Cohnella zeiphila TaxID=2761120 RepID=UPI00192D1E48|nr:putative phage tail protein [Cohnella zeiphila]